MSRISSIFRDVEVLTRDLTSPEAKSRRLAEFAAERIAEARATNRQASGRDTPYEIVVDGRKGAPLASVRPDGVVVANFDLVRDVLEWVGEQLLRESPRLTGKYEQSHRLFVDGVEHSIGEAITAGEEYAFLNVQPYSRKIERGQSDQAPEGVYQAIAVVAERRFGNIASIGFSYRSPLLSYVPGAANRAERKAMRKQPARLSAIRLEKQTRVPAIIVRPF